MDPLQNAKCSDDKAKLIVLGDIHDTESRLKLPQTALLITSIILGFCHHAAFIAAYLSQIPIRN